VRLAQPLDAVFDAVEGGWRPVTEAFRASPAGRALIDFVDGRVRAGATVYPPEPLRALALLWARSPVPLARCLRALWLQAWPPLQRQRVSPRPCPPRS